MGLKKEIKITPDQAKTIIDALNELESANKNEFNSSLETDQYEVKVFLEDELKKA